ncbi:MAG: hypothetical protein V1789_07980 [PVC group bacterium]
MMNAIKVLTVLLVIIAAAGCGEKVEQKVVDDDQLIELDGLQYEVNSEEPFTGKAVLYWPNGQKSMESEFRDGKEHGKFNCWNENGQKMDEFEYCDGKLMKWFSWYESGQKKRELEVHDNGVVSKKCWDKHGNHIDCEELWKKENEPEIRAY